MKKQKEARAEKTEEKTTGQASVLQFQAAPALKQELGDEADIDRAILWKKGHVDKDGNYLSETIKQRADKIDALTKDVEEGIVSAIGKNDILTQALETPEQSGHLFLAPYNTGNHWLLAAINPFTASVYYCDPLSDININPGMKNVVEL
ncbi:hypothetical protein M0R45_001950 [Rubus argutus]|uniref:Ubiquitin-like protease family profile domain-containing protein n=1 Tax=Rubus argutus TaxID=59490 RepID=A0AAW1VF30_RUBAR